MPLFVIPKVVALRCEKIEWFSLWGGGLLKKHI